jgi:hypothetical protein
VSFVANHGIENDHQLAHAGGKCGFGMLAPGAQPQIEASDGGIAADSRDRRHVQDASDLGASAPDATTAAQATAVTVKRRQARQGGDLLAIEFSQFGQVCKQGPRQYCANPRYGPQQLITFAPKPIPPKKMPRSSTKIRHTFSPKRKASGSCVLPGPAFTNRIAWSRL